MSLEGRQHEVVDRAPAPSGVLRTWDRTSLGSFERPVRAGRLIRGDSRAGLKPAQNTQDEEYEPTDGSGGCLIDKGIVCSLLGWIKDRVAGCRGRPACEPAAWASCGPATVERTNRSRNRADNAGLESFDSCGASINAPSPLTARPHVGN